MWVIQLFRNYGKFKLSVQFRPFGTPKFSGGSPTHKSREYCTASLLAILYESISSNKELKYYQMCIHVSHESFDVLIFKKESFQIITWRQVTFYFCFCNEALREFFFDFSTTKFLDNFEILSKDQSRLLVFWSKDMLNDLQMGFIWKTLTSKLF